MNAIEARLGVIARSLAWLQPRPVFIGGATIGLYLDAFGRSQLRPTLDVDCIVPALLASRDWWTLEAHLRRRAWQPVLDKRRPLIADSPCNPRPRPIPRPSSRPDAPS